MTWLSRLLPQSPNLQRLANQNHRFRQGQRRRRSMNLELLESRTLLSNVTTSMPTPSSPLTITGDTSNDNFVITENTNGTVTVAPGSLQDRPGYRGRARKHDQRHRHIVHDQQCGVVDRCQSPGHHQL